jgi:hypothetical protein
VNSGLSIEHQVGLKLIINDMTFARRCIQGVVDKAAEPQCHLLAFNMLRYLSLYIYESHKALEVINPEFAALLLVEHADIIERARHTVKLFDDTNDQLGNASGVTSQMANIASAHRGFFLNNTWFPPARVLETDLAEYRYRGRLFSTTHTVTFHLGLPPEIIRNSAELDRLLLSLSERQTIYIRSIAEAFAWEGPSFMDVLDLGAARNKDVRASRFYEAAFDPGLSDEVTAVLVAFQSSMNFLDLMVAEETNPASTEATFKLQLVVLYHVLSSLAKFKAAFGASLAPASTTALDAILDHPTTAFLTDPAKKGLRNTLMHYLPRGAAVVAQLSFDRPLCGLVEAYYPSYDFAGMSKVLDDHAHAVAELLDDWSALGR